MYVCNHKHEKHSSVFPDFLPVPMKNQALGFTHYRSCVFLQNLHYASRSPITSKFLCCLNPVVWTENENSFEEMRFAKGVWKNHEIMLKFCAVLHSFFILSLHYWNKLEWSAGKLSESANIKFLLIKLLHNFTYWFLLRSVRIFNCCLINILSPHLLDQLWTVREKKYFKVSWLYLLNPPSLFNWIHNVFYANKWQSL